MTREEKVQKEGRIIKEALQYIKENQIDKKLEEYLDKAIEGIFYYEMKEMGVKYHPNNNDLANDVILSIVSDPNMHSAGRQRRSVKFTMPNGKTLIKTKSKITYNKEILYKGLDNKDVQQRLFCCKRVFKTIFHEIQHFRQAQLVETGVSSKKALMFAKDFALHENLGNDFYHEQYDEYSTEADANRAGYEQYLEAFGEKDEDVESLRDLEKGILSTGQYNGKERDDAATKILDDLICKQGKTEILKDFPVLQKEYNLDGTRKTASQLISNMKQEEREIWENSEQLTFDEMEELANDSKEMYYELIYRALENVNSNEFDSIMKEFGADEITDMLVGMRHYFDAEKEDKISASHNKYNAKIRLIKKFENIDETELFEGFHKQNEERFTEYYGNKNSVISRLEQRVLEVDREKRKITPEDIEQSADIIGITYFDIQMAEKLFMERVNKIFEK